MPAAGDFTGMAADRSEARVSVYSPVSRWLAGWGDHRSPFRPIAPSSLTEGDGQWYKQPVVNDQGGAMDYSGGNEQFDDTINRLVGEDAAQLNDKGQLEVKEAAAADVIGSAARAGIRLEVMGLDDQEQLVIRPARRKFETFVNQGGRITTNNADVVMPVMID
ncbi:MAG TPA: hypothetical protein VIS95_10200 [Solirubrobacterales bacterium]